MLSHGKIFMKRTVASLLVFIIALPVAAQTSAPSSPNFPRQLPVELPTGKTGEIAKPSTPLNPPETPSTSPSPIEKVQKKSSSADQTSQTSSQDKGSTTGKTATSLLEVTDQGLIENKVVVSRVVISKRGWLVIHGDVAGHPGPILGKVPLNAGESTNLAVTLIVPPKTQKLWAMLHVDEGKPGVYDFEIDGPLEQDGSVVTQPFSIK
jgi:hypothetical protein